MAAQYVADIGRRIRERREELGMTQEAVARELPGKISGNQVSRWERGAHRPGDAQLESLATVLKVTVAYFLSDAPSLNDETPAQTEEPMVRPQQLDRIEEKIDQLIKRTDDLTADAIERDELVAALLAALREQGNGGTARDRKTQGR